MREQNGRTTHRYSTMATQHRQTYRSWCSWISVQRHPWLDSLALAQPCGLSVTAWILFATYILYFGISKHQEESTTRASIGNPNLRQIVWPDNTATLVHLCRRLRSENLTSMQTRHCLPADFWPAVLAWRIIKSKSRSPIDRSSPVWWKAGTVETGTNNTADCERSKFKDRSDMATVNGQHRGRPKTQQTVIVEHHFETWDSTGTAADDPYSYSTCLSVSWSTFKVLVHLGFATGIFHNLSKHLSIGC